MQIGDWGREGGLNQTAVAAAMAQKAKSFSPQFVVSVGDNFYESELPPEGSQSCANAKRCLYNCV